MHDTTTQGNEDFIIHDSKRNAEEKKKDQFSGIIEHTRCLSHLTIHHDDDRSSCTYINLCILRGAVDLCLMPGCEGM